MGWCFPVIFKAETLGGKGSKNAHQSPGPRPSLSSRARLSLRWAGRGGLTSWAVLSSPSVRALCPHPTHPELPRGPVRGIHTRGAGASRTHPGITVILCFPQLQNSIFLTQTGWGAANMSSPHPLPRKQELWPRHRQERRKRGEHPRDGKRARASHP